MQNSSLARVIDEMAKAAFQAAKAAWGTAPKIVFLCRRQRHAICMARQIGREPFCQGCASIGMGAGKLASPPPKH